MKRSRSHEKSAPTAYTPYGEFLTIPRGPEQLESGLITPPPEKEDRPSKILRRGSKLFSALRSLTNSGVSDVSTSAPCHEALASPASNGNLSKKVSLSFMRAKVPPTVVHRIAVKPRPSVLDMNEPMTATSPDTSPSTSAGTSGNSGKSSAPGNVKNSTAKTSLDSKFAALTKVVLGQAQRSSENKRSNQRELAVGSSLENQLTPILEMDITEIPPEPVPSVVTAETAAATKIFFETHYNELFSAPVTPRSLRRRELEGALYEDITLSHAEKEIKRRNWARRETGHLREIRAMKSLACGENSCAQLVSQYEIVKVLGKGSFGVVRLVREKNTDSFENLAKKKEVYAMKVIRKSDMLRNSQEGHLRAERDFLVASEGSCWIVPLISSFQDANHLYLVMEYMAGGDFLGLLIRENILPEPVTKFYIAEMILCIEEAHALHWIHRDVKPDNFLISSSGHLKISDFGLAFDGHWSHDQSYYNTHRYSLLQKLGITVEGDTIDKREGRSVAAAMKMAHAFVGGKQRHEKFNSGSESEGLLNWRNRTGNRSLARSVVGTSQYMAPEVIKGDFYDARCDWWSVGIILYECLYGHTPFLAEEGGRAQTKNNITEYKKTFHIPSKPAVSSRCQDLMRRMIRDKSDRICSKRYRAKDVTSSFHHDYSGRYVYPQDGEEIKAHRWFKDIQWDKIHLMTPPFVPAIRSVDDTQYFDEDDPISDFSTSRDDNELESPTAEDIDAALRCFNREIQILARSYVATSYDSVRLRKIDREIGDFVMGEEQKEYLRRFVRAYGHKEKKRPRDKLLRDKEIAGKVLEVRKKSAFLGYSYRRIRRHGSAKSSLRGVAAGPGKVKPSVWHRGRISIL